uniref:Zf-AD domain-containing protein n=1 Tax=Anopheles funestus TaxID=62324 RepID=A0A182RE05_ANOFN
MENIGQSNFLPVDSMGESTHKSLDQSCKNYTMPRLSNTNGCCRLCFKGNCHLQELFPGGYTEELLISKIFECTTVEITFANDPDALICYSCVAKIEEFHRYREQCRSNDIQHKNSKRLLGGKNLTDPPSTLIPAKYVKKEIDSEGFEISAADFFPPDTAEQSYGVLDSIVDGPTSRVVDSSGAVDSTIPNEDGVSNSDEDAVGDENLLELMPERTHDEFSVSYTDMNEEYENNNEVFCEMPIKEEPQDIDDGPDEWNDFGMEEDDTTMDHNSTNLIPLIENCSYSTNSENDLEEQRPYREVYNGSDLICLMQDGFLYLQVNKMEWRCRIKDCGAAVFLYEYSSELEPNGVSHVHNREVENSTTDMEILRLLENTSTPPAESEDESFHYVKNIRKGSSIVYKGYKYSMKHRNVDGTTYWKCRSSKGNCSAALYQTPNNKFKTVGAHTHSKQGLTKAAQKPYVSSVSTECDDELGDKSSPGKIKLRIARQTDVTNTPTLKHPIRNGDEKKKIPINQKDAQGVVRRSYDYKIVNNANGRMRLHFDGHLYVRESSRKEDTGTVVVWRCRRNYDMCGVAALQYEDGLVEVIGDHDHSPIKKTMNIPDNSVGTTAYKLLPTCKGGEALILDGYRYVKAYNKPNGMSLWRCTALAGITCRVKIILATDGVAYVVRNVKHNHSRPKHKRTVHPDTLKVSSSSKQKESNSAAGVDKKTFRIGTESATSTPTTMRSKMNKAMHKPVAKSDTVATSSASGQTAKVSSKLQSMRNFRVIKNKKGNKALVHGGYRYCKVRTRQDGIISWFCRMNKKTCRVGLYQYPDGRLEWINQSRHNHSPTDPAAPEQPKKIVTQPKKSTYHMDDETFVSNEWYFVRNRKNGITLIHAGYRYHRKGIRIDSTSMWRCSRANQGCRAGIVMHSDETIAKFDNIDHDHSPPSGIMEGETIISGDPDESMKQASPNTSIGNNGNAAELSLVHFNGCIEEQDDPEANMRTLLSTMLDVSDEPANKSSNKIVLSPSKANYRYIKNRRLTKSLVFRGYRYSRSSMQIRADGSMKWICQMNKKTCRVSVKVLKDGSLEMDDQKHNHPQLPEDMDENDEDNDDDNDTVDSTRDTTLNTTNQEDGMDNEDAHDYFFALNRSNGTSLIFQRNRFSKESTRPDGSTIWRCMVRTDCVAKAILHADGTCNAFRDSNHHHPPLDELPKPMKGPIKFSSLSAQKQLAEKRPAAKLTVKGDMLIYKQNRLKKVKSFSDGTAVFKCAEVDRCTSVVKIQYDETDDGVSSPWVISETAHNHPNYLTDTATTGSNSGSSSSIITKTEGKSKRKSPIKMQKYCASDSVEQGKDYQLFKNDRGHVSLVYKGYRFSLRNQNVNGNSSWKCRANKTCNAYVTFTEDGHVVRAENEVEVMPHNHAINGEFIERGVALDIGELSPPAENLSQFVSNWVNGMYKSELGGKMKTSLKSSTSHNDGKKTICHKNYSYKLQTIKNGREFWRCTMFKARACRAALFCSSNGTIIEYENGRQHNHEAIKPSATAMQKASSGYRGKTHDEKTTGVFYEANEAYGKINEVQKTVKRSHSSMHYDDQSIDESSAPPAYQIMKKDGVDTLHYERHRYVVIVCKRETKTDEPKRWRCCLWNSRHQCPVELTILATGEINFETDPTHNHRPPPPESQEVERVSVLNTKGTRKYEVVGRKMIVYKGYKFQWKEVKDSWAYYNCLYSISHGCSVTVKVDSHGMLFECSNESHNHRLALLNDQSDDSAGVVNRVKPMSERAIASRQERLSNCPKTGSNDYTFVRSCLGNSMLFEGHRYWLHSKLSCGLFVYRCRYQKAKSCTGAVYMDMDTQLMYHRYDAEHNHEPMPEDAVVNSEKPAGRTSTSDNSVLPISQQLSTSTQDDQTVDDIDERDLASDIDSGELLQPEVLKIEEENDNVIITPNYTFVKNYLNKNQLLYEDYVYEFVPLSYREDSDKFYSCLFSDCSASVKLLPSGNLKVLRSNQHAHERPDLTDCRDVGRGSIDFSTISPSGSSAGGKSKILFEGYLYYTNVTQTFQDDTKVFHCHSNVLTKEKSKSNARCSALLELLPNNRVIVTGIHHHSTPKLSDSDTKKTSHTKIMVLDGRSYRHHNTHPDGTIIWQCADDPKCKAKVYGKPNGKLVYGTAKHVLRHIMPKLPNHSANDLKISLPLTSTSVKTAAVPTAGSLIPSASNCIVPTGSLRTKWYQGNRYNFYLTRRDGVQCWRCCMRIEEKCEAGILCYPSGAIMSYNSLEHTHPVLNPSWEEHEAKPLSSYSLPIVKKLEPNEEVARNVCKYPILNKNAANDLYLTYKGVQYSLRKRTSDGICIYRCRNKPCTHTLIVTKRGKIIPKRATWHSCEIQPESDAGEIVAVESTTANAFLIGASGLGFDKPEIEDPDDLVDQNDSNTMEPILKRIRLDSNIEMVEDHQQRTIVQTMDSFSSVLNTETDAEEEEVPHEENHSEMQSSLETGNVETDEWDHEYLEQEFEGTDAIETADCEPLDRRPIDDEDDDDDDDNDVVVGTHDNQTIEELATSEHSRESFTLKPSFSDANNEMPTFRIITPGDVVA